MRFILLATILFISYYLPSYSINWELLELNPRGNHLYCVDVFDDSLVSAAGEDGTIVISNNNGNNWEINRLNTYNDFKTIHYVNSNIIICAGEYGAGAISRDGGENWDHSRFSSLENLNAIASSPSKQNILVAGDSGTLILSTNSGNSFKNINVVTDLRINDVEFIDDQKYIAACDNGKFLFSDNLNEAPVIIESETWHNLHKAEVFNDSTYILVGRLGSILITEDSGETWKNVNPDFKLLNMYQPYVDLLHFFDEKHWVIKYLDHDDDSEVSYELYTDDGGESWESVKLEDTTLYLYNAFDFYENSGFAAGDNGRIWKAGRGDSALTKEIIRNYGNKTYHRILTPDNDHILVFSFGDNIEIEMSSNSGKNWIEYSRDLIVNDTNKNDDRLDTKIAGVQLYYEGGKPDILLTGRLGWKENTQQGGRSFLSTMIYKSTDYGKNWSEFLLHDISPWHLSFFNADIGLGIKEEDGHLKLMRTTSSGMNWYEIKFDIADLDSLASLKCVDPLHYLITIGKEKNKYHIYRTTNGGEKWEIIDDDANRKSRYALKFINNEVAFYLTDPPGHIPGKSIIMRSLDGGITWEEIGNFALDIHSYFIDLKFINKDIGFVMSETGHVFYTADGGDDWEKISLRYLMTKNEELVSCDMTPNHRFYALSQFGRIIRSNIISDVQPDYSQNESIAVYPNPADEILYLEMPAGKYYDIIISDIQGKIVERITNFSGSKTKIDISYYDTGTFFVIFHSENDLQFRKFNVVR